MALPFYYTVKVGSTFLTEDGLVTGTPYVSTVKGLDAVTDGVVVQQIIAIDGEPHQQTTQPAKGTPITINCDWLDRAMLFTLKSIRLAAVLAGSTTTLTLYDNGDGDGDHVLTTYFNSIRYPGDILNGKIKDVTLNFTVATAGHLVSAESGALVLAGQEATFA